MHEYRSSGQSSVTCSRCWGSWCSQGMTFMVSVSPLLLFSMSATGQSGRTSPARPVAYISITCTHTTATGKALTPAQMQ